MSSQTWRQNDIYSSELWESMFYTAYTTVRTSIITPIMVVFVFLLLRLAGTRTLTQATLFNKLVMVAIGSLVGSVALRPNSPLTASVIATCIIFLFAIAVNTCYTYGLIPGRLLHSTPTLLFINGHVLHGQLRRCLLTPEKLELRSELRSGGHASWADVFAIVLEPNGSFAIITRDTASNNDLSLLEDVAGFAEYLQGQHHRDGASRLAHGAQHNSKHLCEAAPQAVGTCERESSVTHTH